MSQDKRDLTRIEDLGEFLHDDSDSEESFELPELPSEAQEDEPGFALDSLEDAPALPEAAAEASPVEETETTFSASDDEPFSLTQEANEAALGDGLEFEASAGETASQGLEADPTSPFEEAEDSAPESFEESSEINFDAPAESQETSEAPETTESYDFTSSLPEAAPQDLRPPQEESYSPKENFEETREFAAKATINDGPAECNPAYSVIARNIRYVEDSEDILSLLKEIGFPEDMREQFQRQLSRGTLLIPRVSEYTAVYVCHRLRRFKLDLHMGLSDLLHPPKNKGEEDKGLVSRKSLGQNQQHHFNFKADTEGAREIVLSTLSQLDGFSIDNYLGVASEHAFLAAEIVESDTTELIHKNYDELALKLKAHALEHKANAVVGINYQLTPMPLETSIGHYRYKLTCTGSLVWVSRLEA